MTLTTETPGTLPPGESGAAGLGTGEAPASVALALSFIGHGIPKPKGSLRHVGHGRLIEQVKNAPWRDTIIWTVANAMPSPEPLTGPLRVEATFTFPKPKSAPKRRRIWPVTRGSGDVDKHLRLLMDAMQAAGAMVDDAQVVEVSGCKRYPLEGVDALTYPGVLVRVYTISEGDGHGPA